MNATSIPRTAWSPVVAMLLLAGPLFGGNELRLLADSAKASENGNASEQGNAVPVEKAQSQARSETDQARSDSVPVAEPLHAIAGYGGTYADLVDWKAEVGITFDITSGVAYDSNTLLADGRTFPNTGALPQVGEWVYWWNFGLSLTGGGGLDGEALGPYYGVDLDGSIFAYSSGRGEAGRDNVEPMIRAYVGSRGGKTDVRFDTMYRIQNGNTVDFSDLDREARRAESDDWRFGMTAMRILDHGHLTGSVFFDRTDFGGTTALNDVDHTTWDGAWFHDPIWADKTSFGLGVRGGHFTSDRNVSQSYWEPSLRAIHEFSPKTDFYGSAGYSFRNFEGPAAINDAGSTSFELGMNWAITDATTANLAAYRTFHPSLVSTFEDFNVTGFMLGVTHALPRDFTLHIDTAYENADYFSTIEALSSTRDDDYWRLGTTLSHPINFTQRFPGTISAFLYWNENQSSDDRFGFDQYFTGLRVDLSTYLGR